MISLIWAIIVINIILKLEALRERRPPWPRQIITLILPTVKMLSLGCERPPPPPPPFPLKKKKTVLDHYLYHDLGMLPLLWWFFAHLLLLQYPDHHQNLISSSLDPSIKFRPNPFITFWVMLSTDRQTDRQTNQRYQKHNLLCQGGNEKLSNKCVQYTLNASYRNACLVKALYLGEPFCQ